MIATVDVVVAVFADYANVTADGKLNILGIFGGVNPPVLPFALPMAYIVVQYEARPAEAGTTKNTRLVILDGDGGELFSAQQDLVVPPAPRPGVPIPLYQVLALGGLTFQKAGDHALSVQVGGEERRSVNLYVGKPTPIGS